MAEAIVDVLEVVEVEEHRRCEAVAAAQARLEDVQQQDPVRQTGQAVVQGLLLGEAPRQQVAEAGREDEAPVDQRPGPRAGLAGRVGVHGAGGNRPEDPVLEDDEAQSAHERQPGLVERQDCHHDEEVEVALDRAGPQVHEHRGGDDEAERRGQRARPAPGRQGRDHGEAGDEAGLGGRVGQAVAAGQGEDPQRRHVQPQQEQDPAVSRLEGSGAQWASGRQEGRQAALERVGRVQRGHGGASTTIMRVSPTKGNGPMSLFQHGV